MHFNPDFPCAYGEPLASAVFRQLPEDFQVEEVLGYEPMGEGEHVYLHVIKRGENTAWIAKQIASLAGVQEMDVGYAGRKDRHAVTSQWFSVYLPPSKPEPDWQQLVNENLKLLAVGRHNHKLRRGEHQANRFVIRLREVTGADREVLQQRLQTIRENGVPNYFGEQRFGREYNNLNQAESLLIDRKPIKSRSEKGIILSAARSWVFNLVLAERVRQNNWRDMIDGEPQESPSGPLWGRGRAITRGELATLEQQVLEPWAEWCNALEHQGLQQERRALVLQPEVMQWQWLENDLEISFSLSAGEFATAVLKEITILTQAEAPESGE